MAMGPISGGASMGPIAGTASSGSAGSTGKTSVSKPPDPPKPAAQQSGKAAQTPQQKSEKAASQSEFRGGGMAVAKAEPKGLTATAARSPKPQSAFPAGPRTAQDVGLRTSDERLGDQERLDTLLGKKEERDAKLEELGPKSEANQKRLDELKKAAKTRELGKEEKAERKQIEKDLAEAKSLASDRGEEERLLAAGVQNNVRRSRGPTTNGPGRTSDEILEAEEKGRARLEELKRKDMNKGFTKNDKGLTDDEVKERDRLEREFGGSFAGRSRGPGRTSDEILKLQDRHDELAKKAKDGKTLYPSERKELDELRAQGFNSTMRLSRGGKTSDELKDDRSGMNISEGKVLDGDPTSDTYGQEIRAEFKGVGPAGKAKYKAYPVDVEADKKKFGQLEAQLKPGAKVSRKALDELSLRTEWPFIEAEQKVTGKRTYANEDEYVQKKLAKTGATRPYIGQTAAETVTLPSNYNFYYELAQSRRNMASMYGSRGVNLPEAPPRPAREAREAVASKPPPPSASEYGLPAKGSVSPRDVDLVRAKETFRALQAYERERIPPSGWRYTSESDYVREYMKNRSYGKTDRVPVKSGEDTLAKVRAEVRNLMSAYYGPEAAEAYTSESKGG